MNQKIIGITNSSNKIIGVGIALGIIFWFFESFVHVFVFRQGSLTRQLLSPEAHEIWMRLVVVGTIIIFSMYAQFLLNQRERADESVREREKFLDSIFGAFQDGISILDRDLNVIRTNSWLNKKFSEDVPLAGKKCYKVFQKRNTACPWCPSLKTIETGKTHSAIVPYPSDENPTGWISASSFPLLNKKGDVIHVIEHLKDITEVKQFQESLREQRDKAQKYLDIAGVIMIVIDSKGDVRLINKRGCEVLGYKEGEITGKNWFDNFLPETMRDEVKSVFMKLMTGEIEAVEYFENPVLTKSGQEPIIAWHNTVLRDKEENLIGTLSSGEDITDRKRAEEEREQLIHELEAKSHDLTEVNAALKVLLKQVREDKKGFQENVLSNVKQLVLPYLERLKTTRMDKDQMSLVGILESNLNDITSPFVGKLSSKFLSLSPMEIRVAELVKAGRKNKEIAELLCLSGNTIMFHRKNLRAKLGLRKKGINLRSHLLSLEK